MLPGIQIPLTVCLALSFQVVFLELLSEVLGSTPIGAIGISLGRSFVSICTTYIGMFGRESSSKWARANYSRLGSSS